MSSFMLSWKEDVVHGRLDVGRHKTSIDGEAKMKPTSGGQKPRVSISRQPAESTEGLQRECPPTQDRITFYPNSVKGSSQDDGMTIILVPGVTSS